MKSFDSKSLNTAVCSRRSLLHFFFFFILNRRFVKSNLYFDRKSRILSSLDDHIRIFVSIEKFTGSKIRSDLYIFFLFFSPSLPYCIHARNLSSPLKHQVKHPRDASLPSSSSSSSPIHRINRTRCTLSLLDSVFRFSRAGISERDLSLPLLQPFPPLSSSSSSANVIARPPRIEKERRCAKVDEKTRCIPSIYRFESENRFGEIASNRRDRDARERERGDCATRDSNIIVYFCTPARQRRKAFERRRQGVGRGERKGREREKKMVPLRCRFLYQVRS